MTDIGSVEELAGCLVQANREGRPIIPVVGAGISADSGFPVLRSIVRYFGKLRTYIDKNLWLQTMSIPASASSGKPDPLADLAANYRARPWEFVRDFGWPDRFQLNEDLLTAIEPLATLTRRNDQRSMPFAVQDGLDQFLRESSASWRMSLLAGHREAIANAIKERALAQARLLSEQFRTARPAGGKYRTAVSKELTELQAKLDVLLASDFEKLGETLENLLTRDAEGKSIAMDLIGDWKRMILDFTHFQGDYADALLARFARNREPNLAHRYLAFLIRRLNVPVIFTMNFDPFIEQALQEEELRPRTFAMEHGLTLPHNSLVREQLAVIKMHGGTHALLLDEQLDRPLNRDYLERFERIVGADPLLLVLGCSGEDVRLLDLVRQTVGRAGDNDDRLRVAWLHFEPNAPTNVRQINETLIRFRRTKSLGGTLTHLYSAIDKLHPSSRSFYLTHFTQPQLLDYESARPIDRCLAETPRHLARVIKSSSYNCILAHTIGRDESRNPKLYANPSASRQLLWMGSSLPAGYILIWVDLESVHSLSAVAGSIIDQCRRYDHSLAPCVLPQDDDAAMDEPRRDALEKRDAIIDNALTRVTRALRRARYFVAFDGLETYTWSPTAHHGDTHDYSLRSGPRRLETLVEFLIKLSERKLGESCFAVSADYPRKRSQMSLAVDPNDPTARSAWGEANAKFDEDLVDRLRRGVFVVDWNRYIKRPKSEWTYGRFTWTFQKVDFARGIKLQGVREWPRDVWGSRSRCQQWTMALAILATFRRTRPLALTHHLLAPVLGAEEVDEFVSRNQELGIFRCIEGGGIWFFRKLRDYIYGQHTSRTSTLAMRDFLVDNRSSGYSEAVFQLLLNTTSHQLVARGWYGATFIQSHDTFSLLEYFYHRLASVRTLTKLIKLVERACESPALTAQVESGRRAFGEAVRSAKRPDDLLESFELDDDFVKTPPRDFLDLLCRRHNEELHRLHRVWRKSESLLRAQVPAEQLLRWCKQFLDDDLKKRCHQVVVGYDDPLSDLVPVHNLGDENNTAALTQLREYLEDFTAKILIDRSDYVQCRTLREKMFGPGRDLMEEIGALLERGALEPAQLRHAHHRLDVINSDLRGGQEETLRLKELLPIATRCARALTRWDRWDDPNLTEGTAPGLHELQLRGLHLLTTCYFRRVCVFSHDGFSGAPSPRRGGGFGPLVGFDALEQADEAILLGSRIARLLSPPQTATPHSPTINAVIDGTLYLPYRDTFLTQQARHRWMRAIQESALHGHGQPKEANVLLEAVDDALREFEKARAGLSGTNQLTLALTDLHAVEACLAHARVVLHEKAATPKKANVDCFKLARSRYETARGLLGRARTALMGAQRNVIWWRLFFQLAAQYHVDRLLLGFTDLICGEESLHAHPAKLRLGNFIHRLRTGLECIKNASDLYLRAKPLQMNWTSRLQNEMTLCGFAIGLVGWRLCGQPPEVFGQPSGKTKFDPRRPATKGDIIAYLLHPLFKMTHAAGLERWPEKELKASLQRIYEEVPMVGGGEFMVGGGLSVSAEALTGRSEADVCAIRRQRKDALAATARHLRDRLIRFAASPL